MARDRRGGLRRGDRTQGRRRDGRWPPPVVLLQWPKMKDRAIGRPWGWDNTAGFI